MMLLRSAIWLTCLCVSARGNGQDAPNERDDQGADSVPMVLAAPTECVTRVDTVRISVGSEAACDRMQGVYRGHGFCELDLCSVSENGEIAWQYVWGLTTDSIARQKRSEEKVSVTVEMNAAECQNLTGRNDDVGRCVTQRCHVKLVRQLGESRMHLGEIWTFGGRGTCTNQAADWRGLYASPQTCTNLGGQPTPGTGWVPCLLDLCHSFALSCVPCEEFEELEVCDNCADGDFPGKQCRLNITKGVTFTAPETSAITIHPTEMHPKLGQSLQEKFTTKFDVCTADGADSNWENSADFTAGTSYIAPVMAARGKFMLPLQRFGVCGIYRVWTSDIIEMEIDCPVDAWDALASR